MLPANQIHCWEHPEYGNPHCLRGLLVHSDRRNSSRLNLQINIKLYYHLLFFVRFIIKETKFASDFLHCSADKEFEIRLHI